MHKSVRLPAAGHRLPIGKLQTVKLAGHFYKWDHESMARARTSDDRREHADETPEELVVRATLSRDAGRDDSETVDEIVRRAAQRNQAALDRLAR